MNMTDLINAPAQNTASQPLKIILRNLIDYEIDVQYFRFYFLKLKWYENEHNDNSYTEHKNLKAYIYIFNTFLYRMTEIEILISNIINNPVSFIEILINSIKYNPTAWVVSIAILIVSLFAFTYGCLTSRKDYIILTFFLLSVGTALTLLFYVSALSGFKIEFII